MAPDGHYLMLFQGRVASGKGDRRLDGTLLCQWQRVLSSLFATAVPATSAAAHTAPPTPATGVPAAPTAPRRTGPAPRNGSESSDRTAW